MADGLDFDNDADHLLECLECELPDGCCDDSCEGRIWVAPCNTIDYTTGLIADDKRPLFCEVPNVTAMSHSTNVTLREKRYQGCKMRRRPGIPDFSYSLTFDICQGDNAIAMLLENCPIDFFIAPKANNINFEANESPFDQRTLVYWGRSVGDTFTWEYPDDDCQNTTREFYQDGYCWKTRPEALIEG